MDVGKCIFLTLWEFFFLGNFQLPRFARDAVLYAESLLDSVMGGLEGLINILDSEGGYGSLDKKVLLFLWILSFTSYLSYPDAICCNL